MSSQIGGIPWTSPYAEGRVVFVVDQNGAAAWKLPERLEDSVKLERLWQTKVASTATTPRRFCTRGCCTR